MSNPDSPCEMTTGAARALSGRSRAAFRRSGWLLLAMVLSVLLLPGRAVLAADLALAADRAPVVLAAASLTDALGAAARLWASGNHPMPRLSFASSAVLARQAADGAPADLFLSADLKWMDWLQNKGLVEASSRVLLLGNDLVLVEPRASLRPVTIGPALDADAVLGRDGRLAVGDPGSVPAGLYARQALQHLGLWNGLSARLAPAENVRAALLLVERGEAPAGIVYGSDVHAAPTLAVAGVFPPSSHDPILYPAALLRGAPHATEAADFLRFLQTEPARSIFRRAGFQAPAQASP
ncbi:molybdate ABC transporter substrate-binding protein [Rhizosaccharibacter radicis]|uniref:Molybdate ABC transporter substrate-binding protein n=1 Tax=Rhizosaccharibacter radicis TaxID=2782605 RepID=A0ABT1VUF8_9PROT|nr:molybdate ABC transporter substrate-binding protein [Acetobacteraceae bacterium KSS12]